MAIKKTINNWVRKSTWYSEGELKDCQKFFDEIPYDLGIVNFGSNSAKYAFDYSGFNINGFNFAMGPQCLRMDLNLFRHYKNHLKKGAIVLIPLCPFSSMAGYNYDIDTKYHMILPKELVPNYSKKTHVRLQRLKDNPLATYPLMRLLVDIKNFFKREQKVKDYSVNADNWLKAWKSEFGIEDLNSGLSEENAKNREDSASILSSLIKECRENGFTPYVIMPPISQHLTTKMTHEMRKTYIYDYIQLAGIRNQEFLNFLELDDIYTDMSLYRNAYFLNEKGAKAFTNTVLTRLQLI